MFALRAPITLQFIGRLLLLLAKEVELISRPENLITPIFGNYITCSSVSQWKIWPKIMTPPHWIVE